MIEYACPDAGLMQRNCEPAGTRIEGGPAIAVAVSETHKLAADWFWITQP
jgi:hypothetical protein